MKIKRLRIRNIGILKDVDIEINKPLILFFGDVRQGKTSVLNAVKWTFGGSFPEDIIRHGETEASIVLETDDGSITREFYKGKNDVTIARPIVFIRDGKPVKKPVDEIKKFLNPFLLDQDHLRKMTELERKNYFAQLFAVDTSEIDSEYSKIEANARDVRSTIKGYGEIDLTQVTPINVEGLKTQLSEIRNKYRLATFDVEESNKGIQSYNNRVVRYLDDAVVLRKKIEQLEVELKKVKKEERSVLEWIEGNSLKKELPKPSEPDTETLETEISKASANEVRVEQYQRNLARAQERKADQKNLFQLEEKQRDLKKAKIAKLAEINETCKIKSLSFDETGNFTYEGVSAGMLSGSQVLRLSEELSNLYPKDLGISLIDRGESLGKSIFLLIDRAIEEEKTILCTVVGESSADISEDIGVFTVKKGEIKNGK